LETAAGFSVRFLEMALANSAKKNAPPVNLGVVTGVRAVKPKR
jgi:hypothetical protein